MNQTAVLAALGINELELYQNISCLRRPLQSNR